MNRRKHTKYQVVVSLEPLPSDTERKIYALKLGFRTSGKTDSRSYYLRLDFRVIPR